MSVYSQKQRWKIVLFISALLIVFISLWYTNKLVEKIAQEERIKVKLWADAIQKKGNLVKYTNDLFNKLKTEERKRMELWADATKMLFTTENDLDRNFYLTIVNSNTTIPVILTDENQNITSWRNLDAIKADNLASLSPIEIKILTNELEKMKESQKPIEIPYYKDQKNYLYYNDSKIFTDLRLVLDDIIKSFISEIVLNSATVPVLYTDSSNTHIIAAGNLDSLQLNDSEYIKKLINQMRAQNQPIEIEFDEGQKNYIFYKESLLLMQLKFYPYIQLAVFAIFLMVAYSLFSTARRSEQNQVWVGMAKETAHQLGTPLSSLIAWMELLKLRGLEDEVTIEIGKDIHRLETITERFSKIGSKPEMQNENVIKVLENSISYLKLRVSNRVEFNLDSPSTQIFVPLNVPLFEWVIENLCKNAIDAMNGKGSIHIDVDENIREITIDITDTGKGISSANLKTVFQPGFTTKKRGWGLGLSLAKRIVEIYHSGRIFVKRTELNKGTTFRIILRK
ncbi:MAG: HAMP domain-containing histidine kinase [Bacteroidetes bacterium]|nr:HAMP domain-containing histidine kinase [Bacteroidota bacterium]HET6245629.1 HAMP domain-containing sensor histidine kinase [Bacteroidia bacterium]